MLWAISNSLWDSKAKTSVVQVLKLQSTGGESSDYASEGSGYKTRNLLFVKSDGGSSTWLFPDQSRFISRIERLTETDGRTKAIFLESRSASEKKVSTLGVYLARPEGSIPVEVLHDITHLVSKRISGDYILIVYQKYLEIKEARISLKSFERVTDKTIANLVKIP